MVVSLNEKEVRQIIYALEYLATQTQQRNPTLTEYLKSKLVLFKIERERFPKQRRKKK